MAVGRAEAHRDRPAQVEQAQEAGPSPRSKKRTRRNGKDVRGLRCITENQGCPRATEAHLQTLPRPSALTLPEALNSKVPTEVYTEPPAFWFFAFP